MSIVFAQLVFSGLQKSMPNLSQILNTDNLTRPYSGKSMNIKSFLLTFVPLDFNVCNHGWDDVDNDEDALLLFLELFYLLLNPVFDLFVGALWFEGGKWLLTHWKLCNILLVLNNLYLQTVFLLFIL